MIQVRKPVAIMKQQWNPPTGPRVTVSFCLFARCRSKENNVKSNDHTWVLGHRYLVILLALLRKERIMRVVITLAIHLVWCAIWRRGVSRVLKVTVAVLLELLNASRGSLVLARDLRARLVADGWELNRTASLLITRSRGTIGRGLTIRRDSSGSGTLFIGLSLVLLFLLAGFPLLSDFLELCGRLCVSVLVLHKESRSFGRPMLAPDWNEVIPSPSLN